MNNYNLTEYNSILHSIQYALPKSQLADGVAKILLGSQFKEEKTNDESTYQFVIDTSDLKEAEPYIRAIYPKMDETPGKVLIAPNRATIHEFESKTYFIFDYHKFFGILNIEKETNTVIEAVMCMARSLTPRILYCMADAIQFDPEFIINIQPKLSVLTTSQDSLLHKVETEILPTPSRKVWLTAAGFVAGRVYTLLPKKEDGYKHYSTIEVVHSNQSEMLLNYFNCSKGPSSQVTKFKTDTSVAMVYPTLNSKTELYGVIKLKDFFAILTIDKKTHTVMEAIGGEYDSVTIAQLRKSVETLGISHGWMDFF